MHNVEPRGEWRDLCELASKEQNSEKLIELIGRITQALDESCNQREARFQVVFND